MKHLPTIDEYSALIPADRAHTWTALLRVVRGLSRGRTVALARVLGASPSERTGDWAGDLTGVTIPGFAVGAETEELLRLDLRGQHRFARYALVFELDDAGGGTTRVRAKTLAEFPGFIGRCYRALVIGTRAHRVIVKHMLRRVTAKLTP